MSISAHQIIEVDCPVRSVDKEAIHSRLKDSVDLSEDKLSYEIDTIVDTCVSTLHPKGAYKLFNPAICTLPPAYTEPGIKLVGTLAVLKGQCVYDRMKKATHCVMMASSAGNPEEIRQLQKSVVENEQDAAIVNTCLNVIAERAADMTNAAIVQEAMELGLYTDDFLSPGTEDFPLTQNEQIQFYTQAEQRLGIVLDCESKPTQAGQVLGIVGMYDESQKGRRRACGRCKFREFCSIRAIGMNCHGRRGKFK